MKPDLQIDVGFDLICPWCLIGLRNLRSALQQLQQEQPAVQVKVDWRGMQLLPDVPAAGWPFLDFYRRRLGSDTAVQQRQAVVQQAAQAAGARIDYSVIQVMPNSADAHRLLAWVASHGSVTQRDALLERLLCAYFEAGADLGDPEVLLEHGMALGFARETLLPVLQGASQPYRASPPAPASSGVPSFAINGRLALTGAQPPQVLLAALRAALQTDTHTL